MCGLVGFLGDSKIDNNYHSTLTAMANQIKHRGPDDEGIWHDVNGQIGLAHRRLSILDLSPAGHQPMQSISHRYMLAYNGEIYNHLDLRVEIEKENKVNWRGHSDTETLLAGFDLWGIEQTIEKCIGMFAISVWDKKDLKLTLIRDRAGEKPLYYGWNGEVFLFGSELKALKQHPAFQGKVSRSSLNLYLRHNYIPAPHSIYDSLKKLPAGHMLTVSMNSKEPQIRSYWSLSDTIAKRNMFTGSDADAVNELDRKLTESVSRQMIADVPLGAFLSGGIDSSTIVGIMQACSKKPVKTFSIGFNIQGYNEAVHAKAVASHLGTEHTELYVESKDALNVIPKLSSIYDEPFSDSSQIPTFLVSELAKKHVTVSLSGDAGDELFAGYTRYEMTNNLWAKISKVPLPVRKTIAAALGKVPTSMWSSLFGGKTGDKLQKGLAVITSPNTLDLYKGLASHHWNPSDLIIDSQAPSSDVFTQARSVFKNLSEIETMMALDFMSYLPDDILVKVDRAAMAVSLETRVPFLDHTLIEFAWSLPLSMKIKQGQAKWPLKQVLYKYVPQELVERPKMGFGVPLAEWLRGPLRDWAEDLLSIDRISRDGFFNALPIRKMWEQHLSGQRNWAYLLWDILMFQEWLENQ